LRTILTSHALAVEDVRPTSVTASKPSSRERVRRAGPLHIPSLDGLRAVSFLIVFLAHAGVARVPGGFGVTVFFYLSGFLITTLMRLEREKTGTVHLGHFYLRRALRILPPFYLILVFACALTAVQLLPGELRPGVVAMQALHVSNYWFIAHGSDGSPAGTVPYWSLAVEEHFYLLFPMLYIVLSRYLSREAQARVLVAICAAICVWRVLLVGVFDAIEDRTYMASDTRFDSIFFGCALAIGMNPALDEPRGSDRLWKWGLLPAGLALLILTFVYRAEWFRETIRYTLQGIALTPVFVTAIRFPNWLFFRVLNTRAVAFVGVLSYSLYLVHQVILFLLGYQLWSVSPLTRGVLALLLSLGIAATIHFAVEKPSARLRKRLAHNAATA
jgi:peptidoglycan/LPS O-acetylase OafA/YrhL